MENKNKSEFAKNFEEVAEISSWFRQENIDIEEGLAKLKRGVKLVKKCQKRFGEIENDFAEITKEFTTNDENEASPD